MYYAGYCDCDTDIAVFETKEEMDGWLKEFGEFTITGVREYSADDVETIIGKERIFETDPFGILWLLNPNV